MNSRLGSLQLERPEHTFTFDQGHVHIYSLKNGKHRAFGSPAPPAIVSKAVDKGERYRNGLVIDQPKPIMGYCVGLWVLYIKDVQDQVPDFLVDQNLTPNPDETWDSVMATKAVEEQSNNKVKIMVLFIITEMLLSLIGTMPTSEA
ncbi:hypothetical protein MG293_013456 [Ovis ammon polii]|uniref:Uncharacterized protein n=1 Tax=Ovis ammon polii TaxID=230172 RepID=A0AAD4Y5V7_OVIAM|nr:hypothetical protein MG293_013456 [Ovis ammon polii]KAI4557181.1 hypothetical protein MJT46_013860 [Ovis ammon polii x Ovis aries]